MAAGVPPRVGGRCHSLKHTRIVLRYCPQSGWNRLGRLRESHEADGAPAGFRGKAVAGGRTAEGRLAGAACTSRWGARAVAAGTIPLLGEEDRVFRRAPRPTGNFPSPPGSDPRALAARAGRLRDRALFAAAAASMHLNGRGRGPGHRRWSAAACRSPSATSLVLPGGRGPRSVFFGDGRGGRPGRVSTRPSNMGRPGFWAGAGPLSSARTTAGSSSPSREEHTPRSPLSPAYGPASTGSATRLGRRGETSRRSRAAAAELARGDPAPGGRFRGCSKCAIVRLRPHYEGDFLRAHEAEGGTRCAGPGGDAGPRLGAGSAELEDGPPTRARDGQRGPCGACDRGRTRPADPEDDRVRWSSAAGGRDRAPTPGRARAKDGENMVQGPARPGAGRGDGVGRGPSSYSARDVAGRRAPSR